MSDWPPGSRIFLDTAPVIYLVEAHPRYAVALDPLFDSADQGLVEIVVSTVTIAECLVGPWRRSQSHLVDRFRHFVSAGRAVEVHDIDLSTCEGAAGLRASSTLRLLDAMQVASAQESGCGVLLTNDKSFRQLSFPRVVLVDELLQSPT